MLPARWVRVRAREHDCVSPEDIRRDPSGNAPGQGPAAWTFAAVGDWDEEVLYAIVSDMLDPVLLDFIARAFKLLRRASADRVEQG